MLTLAAGALAVTMGCAAPRQADWRSTTPVSVAEPSAEADALWEAIQISLRRRGYTLDRVDRASGAVTTLPQTSQHFFEVWRRDVATARDAWEASLNPIRRWAEVTLRRSDDGTWTELAVAVHKERLSSPDRQFNSTGAAYQYFGDSLPSTTGHYRVTVKDDRWLDLGRDAALEDALLREIVERQPEASGPPDAAPPRG